MKKIRIINRALVSLFVLFLPLTSLPLTYAAEYGSIGGKPANPDINNPRTKDIFVYKLDINESKRDGFRVFNNSPEKKTILVYAVDSVKSTDGAFACAQMVDEKKRCGYMDTVGQRRNYFRTIKESRN